MAENQENRSREDLTEEASPYRLEEYRRKGIVAQSREVTGLLALLAAGATLWAMSPKMGHQMGEFMKEVFRVDLSSRLNLGDTGVLRSFFVKAVQVMTLLGLPVCLAGFFMGVVGSFAQVGSIFSTDPLSPSFDKINPLAGLKRMFSLKTGFEGIRLVFKVSVLLLVGWALVKAEIFRAPGYVGSDSMGQLAAYARIAKVTFLALAGILAVFAAIDYGLQRWDYLKNLRMTKQEAKQEHKEREGDPQIRARIRSIQREMARRRMMDAVRKADVVVTNPTHIAVALTYDREKMAAPKVVAKGADFLAQKIKQIAAEAGVPRVENVPLARTLYKSVKVGQFVPRALYQAIAEVLAYVYRLKGRHNQ